MNISGTGIQRFFIIHGVPAYGRWVIPIKSDSNPEMMQLKADIGHVKIVIHDEIPGVHYRCDDTNLQLLSTIRQSCCKKEWKTDLQHKNPCAVFHLLEREYCTGAFFYDLKRNSVHFFRGLAEIVTVYDVRRRTYTGSSGSIVSRGACTRSPREHVLL